MKLSEIGGDTVRLSDVPDASAADLPAEPGYTTPSGLASPRAQALRETIVGPQQGGERSWFARQQQIESQLRAQGKTDAEIQSDPQWQEASKNLSRSVSAQQTGMALGAAGGELMPVGQALRAIPAGKIAESMPLPAAIKNALPGAGQKAVGEVSKIGPVTDRSVLGERMMKDLRPNYSARFAERKAELEKVAPADSYIGADDATEAKLNAARAKIYKDPKFADLKEFEDSPLGQQIVRKTGKYSHAMKLDPYDLPPKTFRSAQTVRDLRMLLGKSYRNPQDAVESFASEHTAQQLAMQTAGKDAKAAAQATEEWISKNRAWLNETPVTKALVEHYLDRLQSVAKVQDRVGPAAEWVMKGAAGGLGLGGVLKLMGH